jgi:hypothetical protein
MFKVENGVLAAGLGACAVTLAVATAEGQSGQQAAPAPPSQLSALAPANLAKPRPKPPFDLTGTWQHDGRANTWRFVPDTFKLTPQAQEHAGPQACRSS